MKMTTNKLILFDIDNTLLDVGDSHKRAFQKGFKEMYGVTVDYSTWEYHGYTDLQIIHEILNAHNIRIDNVKIQEMIRIMIKEFENENLNHAFLHEGVPEILEKLRPNKNIILGLVTGNIEEIAHAKLRHFGIDEYFVLGGFGHSSVIRSDLVDIAIRKAEESFGEIDKSDVFIIGDTTRDVMAAEEAGVRVIAVASGTCSYEELENRNPDYLFNDLKDIEKIIQVIMEKEKTL